MQDRGTDQRVAAAMESNRIVRRLVRRLARRDSGALTLPLTLALLGTSVARERSDEDMSSDDPRAGSDGVAKIANAGDRLAIYSHDAVLAEHVLTDADAAAGEVRLALRMIRNGDGTVTLKSALADDVARAGSGSADPEAAHLAAGSEEASAGDAVSEEAVGASANADGASGESVDTGAAAAPATEEEEDDDDRGLLWIVLGVGATGAGIALLDGGGSHREDPPIVINPPDPPPAGLSGQVVKGYVHGAAVYLDTNHDGLPDGDPVYTDAEGRFTFESAPDGASFIVYGGVDTLTHVPLDGMILRAPAGATVVTPLTTLIDEMMRLDDSLTASEAQAKLVSALGLTLPEGADLLTYDSVAQNASGGASIEDAAEAVLSTISSIQSLLAASGALGPVDAAGSAITALAQTLINSTGIVDLTAADDVQQVLEAALNANDVGASNADDIADLAKAMAAVNGSLIEASGLGEQALQATRYALSSFQDLLTKIGANAHSSEQYRHDISFHNEDALYKEVSRIGGGNVDTIIGEHTAASISYAQRLEGQRFVFALNPELKLYEGAPDRIDVVTVKFDVPGVVVSRETRGADGQIVTEVLTADANGRYTLQYDELDKIYIQPPENFNGMLGADVTAHYVGLDIIDAPETLGVEITAVNDAPTSANSKVTGIEDHGYAFSLADFPFSDPADAPYAGGANALAAIRIVSLPTNGTLFLNLVEVKDTDIEAGLWVSASAIQQGQLVFVPPADANGAAVAQFGFQVQDDGGTEHGGKAISAGSFVMTIDLTAVDDAPVAQAAAGVVVEDGVYVFSKEDFGYTDVEGHELDALVIRTVPRNGWLYLDQTSIGPEDLGEDGYVVSFEDIANGRLMFYPALQFAGTETFQFALRDAGGAGPEGANTSAPVGFTITVTPVNDAPVASDKSVSVEENGTHVFSVDDFGFSDIEGDNLTNIIIGSLPEGGTLYFGEDALDGEDIGLDGYVVSVADLESGKLVFVPEAGFNGVVSLEYRVQDDGGTESGGRDVSWGTATLSIRVGNVNDAPVPLESSATLDEDGEYVFSITDFAFEDRENNELAAVIIRSLPESGTLYFDGEPVTLDMLGESGFEVSAADISLLRFEPEADANGTMSFEYQLRDNGGSETSETATFTLSVNAVSDAPVAQDKSVSLEENASHVFSGSDFSFTDVDADSLANIIITSLPANGTLYFDGQALRGEDLGEDGFSVSPDELLKGSLTFVPDAGFNGVAEIEYRVQDTGADGANLSDIATVRVSIGAVNDAPVALESSATIDEDSTHVFSLKDFQFEDAEQDDIAAVLIWTLPAGGTLYFDGEPITEDMFGEDGAFAVTAGDIASSLLTFVPDENLNGPVTFEYRLRDTGGTANGGNDTGMPATFTFNVTPVSDAPVANPSPKSLDEDQDQGFTFVVSTFGMSDADGDELSKVFITSLPASGTLYFDGTAIEGEDLGEDGFAISRENLQNGKLTYVPDGDYNGGDQFQYRVQDSGPDGVNLSDVATLDFVINPVPDAPLGGEDSVTVAEDTVHVFSMDDFNFYDADGDSLASIIITSLPTNGTLYKQHAALSGEDLGEDGYVITRSDLIGGKFKFVPDDDFSGTVYFGYRLKDNSGVEGSDTSLPLTYTINVEPASDTPVASDTTIDTSEDHDRTLYGEDFSFTDGDGDALLAVIIHSLPVEGALRFDGVTLTEDDVEGGFRITAEDLACGKLVFVPPKHYFGSVSFTFQVQDDGGDAATDTSEIVTMTIDVESINDAPKLSLPEYPCDFSPQLAGEPDRVNTYATGNQEDPSIAPLPDGGYVIVWISQDQDGDGYGIFAQIYGADGEKRGEEFQINTETANDQFHPQVIAGPNDGFTVVWSRATEQSGKNITASEVVLRQFDINGETPWDEIPPSFAIQAGLQIEPVVTRSADRTLIVWTSDGVNGFDIRGWLHSAEGGVSNFTINTTTAFDQSEPAVITLADGTFVVSWTGIDGEDDSKGVFAQRIDLNGEPVGEEFRVNDGTLGDQSQPAMAALADGGFVVAWTGVDSSLKGVYVQRYDDCGNPVGKPVLVNTNETNDQRDPAVAALPDGGFLVTWTSWGTTDSSLDVFVQRFDSQGTHLGDPVLVNTVTVYEQTTPAITVLADGGFVVTWQSNNEDGSGYGIYRQQFEPFPPVYIEGGAPVLIAPTATVSDIELDALNDGLGDWTGASIVVQRDGGKHHGHHGKKSSPDRFGFEEGDGYEMGEDGTIFKDEEAIAHFSVEKGKLVITFATYEGGVIPTTGMVNQVLQRITYANTSDDPGESVTLKYRVNDGNAREDGEQGAGEGKTYGTVKLQIIPINDAPEARDSTVRMVEDHLHTFRVRDFRFKDAEDDDLEGVIITSLPENGTLYYNGSAIADCDLGEDGFVVSAWDLACGKLVFEPNENFNGTVSFSYRVQDDGGTARNGEDTSGEATMSLVVKAVNDAPEITLSTARVLVVTTASDVVDETDGFLSLREALEQAESGDVIRFDASLEGTPVLVENTLHITKDVYIDGSTVPDLEIEYTGDATGPVFQIEKDATAFISAVSIDGGGLEPVQSDSTHAAFYNQGVLTLQGVTISGFHRYATGDAGVGVLYNDSTGTVYMSEVTITQNAVTGADNGAGSATHAMLIFNQNVLHTDRVVFTYNTVSGGDGSFGGDAYLLYSTVIGSGDVTFIGNVATAGDGDFPGSSGDTTQYDPGEAGFEMPLPPGGNTVQYKEDEDAVLLAASTQVSDIELDALNDGLGDWSGASITIGRKADGEDHHGKGHGGKGRSAKSPDEYGFVDGNDLTFVDGEILKTVDAETSVIGHYSTSKSGKLTITFSTENGEDSAIPTTEDVNHVLQQITYRNTSDNPGDSITLELRVEDGNARWRGEQGRGGEKKATAELIVNITEVNDAPEPRNNKVRMDEDQSHTFEVRDFRFKDAEGDDLEAVVITSLPDSGKLYYDGELLTAEDLGCDGFVIPAADLACGKLVFHPDEEFNGTVSFGYRVQDDGGTKDGGIDLSDEATMQIKVRAVNDAPEISFKGPTGDGQMDYFDRYADGDGATEGLENLRNLTVSADGLNVYAVAGTGSLVVFMRDLETGALSYLGRFENGEDGIHSLGDPSDLALSDDGRFLYVVSQESSSLSLFSRDEGTGELGFAGYLMDGQDAEGLSAARALTIAPGGKHIYVASPGDGSVAVFMRDADIGSMTFVQKLTSGEDGMYGFEGAADIAVSPEGDLVYVVGGGSNALAIFTRDPDTGYLTFSYVIVDDMGGQDGLANPTSIAVSADGKHVYVTGSEDDSIAVFERFGDTLMSVTIITDGVNGVDGLAGVSSIVISPDGDTVYATGSDDNAVAMFSRNAETGLLTFQRTFVDGVDFVGLAGANALAVSPDGKNVYIGSGDDATIAALSLQTVDGDVEPVTYVENGEAVLLSPYAKVSDVELDARNDGKGDWSGASVTVVRKSEGEDHGHGRHHNIEGNPADSFDFVDGNGLSFVDGEILKTVDTGMSVIGYYELDDGKFVISFGGEGCDVPTTEDVNNVLRQITYSNLSDNPETNVTITYRVNDGNSRWNGDQGKGLGRVVGEIDVDITPVNDAPAVEEPPIVTLNEDESYTFSTSDFAYTDPEDDSLMEVIIQSLPTNGTLYLNGKAITADDLSCGDFTVTPTDLSCGLLTFVPNADYYGSTTFQFQVRDSGGTANGGEDTSATATFTFNMRSVNDAPELDLPGTSGYTFTVTTLDDTEADDGMLSLREALAAAKDGDSITFDAALIGQTIQLVESLIINKQVYINGLLGDGTDPGITLQGNGFTAVYVSSYVGSDVGGAVLEGLAIHGTSEPVHGWPGGLLNAGNLTLAHVEIANQISVGIGEGSVVGGLWNTGGATLKAYDLDIHGITALGSDGLLGDHAFAVLNSGSFEAVDVVIGGNTVTGGGSSHLGASGGSAYDFGNTTNTLFGEVTILDGDAASTLTGGDPAVDGNYGETAPFYGNDSQGASEFVYERPSLGEDGPASVEYSAGGDPVLLSALASVSDVELDRLNGKDGNWSGATITLQRQGGANGEDIFGYEAPQGMLPPAIVWDEGTGTILKNEEVIATFTNGEGVLSIHFTGYGSAIPTTSDVNEILQRLTYSNSHEEADGQVTVEYTVADGNLSFKGTQGSGGEGVTVGTVTVNISPLEFGKPMVTLAEATDTGSVGDGITASAEPELVVTLPEGALEGCVLELYANGDAQPFATHTLTQDDITNGSVTIGAPEGEKIAISARIVSASGNISSDLSPVYFLVRDAFGPDAPGLDEQSLTVRADYADTAVISGSAEAFSTVTVSLVSEAQQTPIEYRVTADADGRFSVAVDATAFVAGDVNTVTAYVSAVDRAGNKGSAAIATITVADADPAEQSETGTANVDEVWAPDEGEGAAVTFSISGVDAGQDYFLVPPGTFGKLTIADWTEADFVITRVDESSFDEHNSVLEGYGASLYDGRPLYLVSMWIGPGTDVFVQADVIEFNDRVLRLTPDGVIATDVSATYDYHVLHGGSGDDRISASAGNDMVFDYDGDDVLLGNDGNDKLFSISGEDTLIGGTGDDALVVLGSGASGNGTANLYGGEGNDIFVIAPQTGFARDVTIHDFVIGEDKLDLSRLRKDDAGVRELMGEDFDFESLTAMLQDDGSLSIDLSQFVHTDGSSLGGTLTLKLAGGSSVISEEDFILHSGSAAPIDVWLDAAQHQFVV